MLLLKFIEPAQTKLATPIVFAPKKGKLLRFWVDFRKLNAVTKRDSYSKPQIHECIDSLEELAVLSIVDVNSGYWEVKVKETNRDKTTFTSHHGLHRFLQMPFGLTIALKPF